MQKRRNHDENKTQKRKPINSIFSNEYLVLPMQQTLKAPVTQSSAVCTPSDMMTATIPQNEKTVSEIE